MLLTFFLFQLFVKSFYQIFFFIYSNSKLKISKYSTSLDEPIAICKNLAKSTSLPLQHPSAMFVCIELAALLI